MELFLIPGHPIVQIPHRHHGHCPVWMRKVTVTVAPFFVKTAVRLRFVNAYLKNVPLPVVSAVMAKTGIIRVRKQDSIQVTPILTANPAVTPAREPVTVTVVRLRSRMEAARLFHNVHSPITVQQAAGAVFPAMPVMLITAADTAGVEMTLRG